MSISGRRRLVGLLVGIFLAQTWLVYSDPVGRRTPPLSPLAAQGQRIWLQHNCQACHQLYGFGGFLGPDLTNAARTLTRARVDLVLTAGSGQMPAFHLSPSGRRSVLQFLTEFDRTGISQPRITPKQPALQLFDHLVEAVTESEKPLTARQAAGYRTMRTEKCIACHLPNHGSAVRAPDLTAVLDRLGEARVLAVLAAGVPGKVMPRFTFTAPQQEGVIAFLGWLRNHRERAGRMFEATRPEGGSLLSLPWFEYE